MPHLLYTSFEFAQIWKADSQGHSYILDVRSHEQNKGQKDLGGSIHQKGKTKITVHSRLELLLTGMNTTIKYLQ